MAKVIEIKSEIEDLGNLKAVTEALTQISSTKVKGSRDAILMSKDYFDELGKVYNQVQSYYQKRILSAKNNGQQMVGAINKIDKRVSICITSSIKFTRELNQILVDYFLKDTGKTEGDVVVVGSFGKGILDELGYHQPYKYVEFSKRDYDKEARELVAELIKYKDIYVYFDRFVTVLTQNPDVRKITYDPGDESSTSHSEFIFEPDIDHIINFFETEILRGLLEEAFAESDLSQYSKQLLMVDSATRNAEELITKEKHLLARSRNKLANTKQIERVAGFSLWGK